MISYNARLLDVDIDFIFGLGEKSVSIVGPRSRT